MVLLFGSLVYSQCDCMNCQRSTENKTQVYAPEVPASIIINETISDRKPTQGPFTGLEGHNFTEDPAIVYPNPMMDILHVKSTDPITVIEILNIHGEELKSFYIGESMDVSDLPAGTYFARINFENINDVQIEQILIVK